MTPADGVTATTIRIVGALSDVDRSAWDACANPRREPAGGGGASAPASFNPFVSWDFLQALEESGSASDRTGWSPRHLVVNAPDGIAAVAPCYVKSHSQGEYVFDWGWADAFERAGGRYYPKLQVSVPFTPVTGPRLLVRDGAASGTREALAAGLAELCRRSAASSVHATFLTEADSETFSRAGYLHRTDQQFHWTDAGYGDFDGFVGALASRKRKALRRERAEALTAGIAIEWITGADLTEAHWDAFFAFYQDTGARKWGQPYLNRRFFSLLGERLADHVLLIMARRDGRYVAGALSMIGSDTLYGRYWGAIEEHPFLHFEVCYYQAIDFALAGGLTRIEAGAQGAHKLARGYLPTITHSAHFIADPSLRRAVKAYLVQERAAVAHDAEALAERAPFRRSNDAGETEDATGHAG